MVSSRHRYYQNIGECFLKKIGCTYVEQEKPYAHSRVDIYGKRENGITYSIEVKVNRDDLLYSTSPINHKETYNYLLVPQELMLPAAHMLLTNEEYDAVGLLVYDRVSRDKLLLMTVSPALNAQYKDGNPDIMYVMEFAEGRDHVYAKEAELVCGEYFFDKYNYFLPDAPSFKLVKGYFQKFHEDQIKKLEAISKGEP